METNRNLQTSQHHYHCSTTRTRKSNENGTTKDYLVAQFQYNQDTDIYLSARNTKTTGSWHKKTTDRDSYNLKNTEPQNAKHVL
jgi:hypothetical protein